MRRVALAMIVVLVGGVATAERFDLRFFETTNSEHPAYSLTFISGHQLNRKPAGLKGVPRKPSKGSIYLDIQIAGESYYALVDASRRTLLLDTNRDGRLSDETPLTGKYISQKSVLGTEKKLLFPAARVTLAGPDGSSRESAPFYVMVSQLASLKDYWFVSVFPTGYRTGTIKYGGQKAAVALIDADLDGRYNGVYGAGGGTDVLIVDINGDGEISSYGRFDGETAPLGRLFHDGKRYWAVTAAEDGTSIAIEPAEPEMGTLKASAPEAFIALWSDAGFHALWGNGGSWQVPAGKYLPEQVGLQDRNRSGAWRLTAEDAGKLQAIALEPGGNAEVAFGPPLKMQVEVSYQKGSGDVSCEVVGRAGEKYPVGAEKNGKVRPAPKIEIIAESGRKLATGRFEYG